MTFFEILKIRRAKQIKQMALAASGKRDSFNLLPPVGQFQNDQPKKGWVFLCAEVATLGAAVGSYWWLSANEQPGHTFENSGRARTMRQVNRASAALFAITLLWGIWDGYANFDPGLIDPGELGPGTM